MHEGLPIFNFTPFFEKELHPPETPDQMKASVPTPEPSKIEAPQSPASAEKQLVKTYVIGSPQDRTLGIEGITKP